MQTWAIPAQPDYYFPIAWIGNARLNLGRVLHKARRDDLVPPPPGSDAYNPNKHNVNTVILQYTCTVYRAISVC